MRRSATPNMLRGSRALFCSVTRSVHVMCKVRKTRKKRAIELILLEELRWNFKKIARWIGTLMGEDHAINWKKIGSFLGKTFHSLHILAKSVQYHSSTITAIQSIFLMNDFPSTSRKLASDTLVEDL